MNNIKEIYNRSEVRDIVRNISEKNNKVIMIEMVIIIVLGIIVLGCITLISLLM